MWKALVILVALSGVAYADDPPPASSGRVVGEVALGTVGSIGGGFSGFLLGAAIARDWEDSRGDTAVVLATSAVGATLGSTLGVWVVGDTDEQTASFRATLAGAGIGVVAGAGAAYAVARDGNNHAAAGLLLIAGPTIGATVGFNLTRKSRIAPVVTSQSVGVAGTF